MSATSAMWSTVTFANPCRPKSSTAVAIMRSRISAFLRSLRGICLLTIVMYDYSHNYDGRGQAKFLPEMQKAQSGSLRAFFIRLCASQRSLCVSLILDFLFGFADTFSKSAYSEVGLLFINDERRREPKGVFTCTQDEQAFMESHVHDGVTQIGGALLRPLI